MTNYEKAVALWQGKKIETDAELAEALNGHSIAFAYHSGKIENENVTYNDTREIFEHDGVISYTGDLRTLFEIGAAPEEVQEEMAEPLSVICESRQQRPGKNGCKGGSKHVRLSWKEYL